MVEQSQHLASMAHAATQGLFIITFAVSAASLALSVSGFLKIILKGN